jgi:hypothetical protein
MAPRFAGQIASNDGPCRHRPLSEPGRESEGKAAMPRAAPAEPLCLGHARSDPAAPPLPPALNSRRNRTVLYCARRQRTGTCPWFMSGRDFGRPAAAKRTSGNCWAGHWYAAAAARALAGDSAGATFGAPIDRHHQKRSDCETPRDDRFGELHPNDTTSTLRKAGIRRLSDGVGTKSNIWRRSELGHQPDLYLRRLWLGVRPIRTR